MSEREHGDNRTTATDPLQNYPDKLIINRPELKSMPLILGERILTLLFWGFWFYLWLPLISVIAWLLGFQILYSHIMALGGLDEFFIQLNIFSIGIFAASGLLALWSFYNLKRYGAYNRRNRVYSTDLHGLASHLSITARELQKIQQEKILYFSFNKRGDISSIKAATDTFSVIEKPQFACTP